MTERDRKAWRDLIKRRPDDYFLISDHYPVWFRRAAAARNNYLNRKATQIVFTRPGWGVTLKL